MAVAIANSKKEAIQVLVDEDRIDINELKRVKPEVYKLNRKIPIGFSVYGGG